MCLAPEKQWWTKSRHGPCSCIDYSLVEKNDNQAITLVDTETVTDSMMYWSSVLLEYKVKDSDHDQKRIRKHFPEKVTCAEICMSRIIQAGCWKIERSDYHPKFTESTEGFRGHVKDFGPYFQSKDESSNTLKIGKALKEWAQRLWRKPRL